jgi:hypothetical protein
MSKITKEAVSLGYNIHNHRLLADRKRRIAVPLLAIAEPCHSFVFGYNNRYQAANLITKAGMLHFPKANWSGLITLQLGRCYLIQTIIILGTWDASISLEHPSIASNLY